MVQKNIDEKSIDDNQKEFIKNYFLDQVLFFVQPTLLDKNKVATFLHNLAIYLAVRLLMILRSLAFNPNFKSVTWDTPFC